MIITLKSVKRRYILTAEGKRFTFKDGFWLGHSQMTHTIMELITLTRCTTKFVAFITWVYLKRAAITEKQMCVRCF